MKTRFLALTLVLGLGLGVLAPNVAQQVNAATPRASVAAAHVDSHAAAFDKTRFVAHLAFAFGAFHHWIYKPYKAGTLTRHHLFTLIKAAAAAAFVYHELHVSYNLAKSSNSKTLQALIAPLNGLQNGFNALKSKVTQGNTSSLSSLQSQTSSFESLAGKNGFTINEQTPSSLSGTP